MFYSLSDGKFVFFICLAQNFLVLFSMCAKILRLISIPSVELLHLFLFGVN